MKKRIKDKSKDNMQLKIGFYVLSLWLLFLLVFLLSVDIPICFDSNATFIGLWSLIKRNWLAIISLVMMLVGAGIARKFKHAVDGVTNPPAKIISIQNENKYGCPNTIIPNLEPISLRYAPQTERKSSGLTVGANCVRPLISRYRILELL